MDINYELYKVFYEVAKYGSFSKTAEFTYTTESAISKSIKKLEEELEKLKSAYKINDLEKFKDLFQIGLEITKIGTIPTFQDQLIIGNVSRSRNHNIKVLFIVGMNDGVFPKASREEGFSADLSVYAPGQREKIIFQLG